MISKGGGGGKAGDKWLVGRGGFRRSFQTVRRRVVEGFFREAGVESESEELEVFGEEPGCSVCGIYFQFRQKRTSGKMFREGANISNR